MSLEPGRTLAHYRLVEKIGQGGMGIVWRAADTKLGRDVAIKVLPAELAADPERLARFEREAKLLASLNHPNIAAIHGLETEGEVRFLVLELIPGQSLAEAIASGPLPIEETLDIARQVAEGLEAAHAAGVIHRDLKPANVRVTPEGTAKVLDFGLAKGVMADGPVTATELSLSPTVTSDGTRDGMILGTAPYMSPEQARAKPLDRRTDVWSFGCLLYECLAGRAAFHGETVTDVLSVILQGEPDWAALPERTSPRVRELLERCLEKNPRNRLHDMADARIELERALAGREWTTSGIRAADLPASPRRAPGRAAAWLAAGLLAGAAMIYGIGRLGAPGVSGPGAAGVVRFTLPAPPGMVMWNPIVSPDGTVIAYPMQDRKAEDRQAAHRLYVHRLDRDEPVPVEGSTGLMSWGFSPDGAWLAFLAPVAPGSSKARIFKVPADGSAPPIAVADWPEKMPLSYVVWLPDGDLVFLSAESPQRIHRFPADGTEPPEPVELDRGGVESQFLLVRALPDGRTVLGTTQAYEAGGFRIDLAAIDVEAATARVLLREAAIGAWSPTGHLLVSRADKLLAVPFDPARGEVTGGPVPIAAGLWTPDTWSGAWFDLSPGGTLVHLPGGIAGSDRRLRILDPDGSVRDWSGVGRLFSGLFELSGDGRWLAAVVTNAEALWEIWISEVDEPRLRLAVAEPGLDCSAPILSADGEILAYACGNTERRAIHTRRVDGSGDPLLLLEVQGADTGIGPASFSPDGTALLVLRQQSGGDVENLLLRLDANGAPRGEPTVLLEDAGNSSFSPDGRAIAYVSDVSGRSEVYLRELQGDGIGPPRQASTDGGDGTLQWRRGSRPGAFELIFNRQGRVLAAPVETEPALRAGPPRDLGIDLVELRSIERRVHPDGRIFFLQQGEEEVVTRIQVVLNFHEEIRRRVAASR